MGGQDGVHTDDHVTAGTREATGHLYRERTGRHPFFGNDTDDQDGPRFIPAAQARSADQYESRTTADTQVGADDQRASRITAEGQAVADDQHDMRTDTQASSDAEVAGHPGDDGSADADPSPAGADRGDPDGGWATTKGWHATEEAEPANRGDGGWHSEVLAGSSWFSAEPSDDGEAGRKRSSKGRRSARSNGRAGRNTRGRGRPSEEPDAEDPAEARQDSGSSAEAAQHDHDFAGAPDDGADSAESVQGGGGFAGSARGGDGFAGAWPDDERLGGAGRSGGGFAGTGRGDGRSGRSRRRGRGFAGAERDGGGGQGDGSSAGSGRRGGRSRGSGLSGEGFGGGGQDADPESVARAICLRLLTMAPKTRAQLAEALRKRDVPDEAAEAVLSRFSELGLINDEAFAAAWVDSRHHGRGLAKRALAAELRHRGVDTDTVKEAVERLDPDQEAETARRLVERKLASTRSLDPQTRTRRLAGMLARKGYASGLAFRVIREALEQEGIEMDEDFP
ncbi:recombination regulator RecX [Nonomuraea sp. NPDC052116]|uniref:recombination regulator RecX n=1 Tax=Nonomuraea sp. NPDC052116 TaxID=3155665 RepID=UPI0034314C2C